MVRRAPFAGFGRRYWPASLGLLLALTLRPAAAALLMDDDPRITTGTTTARDAASEGNQDGNLLFGPNHAATAGKVRRGSSMIEDTVASAAPDAQAGMDTGPITRANVPSTSVSLPEAGTRSASPGILFRTGAAIDDHVLGPWHDGTWDLYLLGYAWHGRGSYSPQAYHALNQQAWGMGVGKHLTDANGNEDLLYAFAFADSHDHVEPVVGYAHQWFTAPVLGGLQLGGGYTVAVTSRVDIFSGIPFPLALPVVSVKYRRFSVMATGLPKVSGVNDGTVILLWSRYEF